MSEGITEKRGTIMKKAIAIALSVCMIFAISACGNKQENGETDSAQNQTQSQKTSAGRVADEYHKIGRAHV